MKRVLVTGANGFCGRYLCRYLDSLKQYEVFGSYTSGSRVPEFSKPLVLDITHEKETFTLIKKLQPDFVCHLAAQSNARLSAHKIEETYRVNLVGTMHLANALRRFSPHARFLYTSSVHVYGRALRSGQEVGEQSFLWPESYYGFSKALSEFACLDLHRQFGLDVVIIRANNYFGPGQSEEFVFSDWCRQIALIELGKQKPVIQAGNLKLRRDFLFVQDGVELYEKLLQEGKSGSVYNVSSGKSLPLEVYLHFLISHAKVPIKIQIKKSRFRADDAPAVRIDNQKLKELGWKPRYSVKKSLQMLLDDWRTRVRNE